MSDLATVRMQEGPDPNHLLQRSIVIAQDKLSALGAHVQICLNEEYRMKYEGARQYLSFLRWARGRTSLHTTPASGPRWRTSGTSCQPI